MAASVRLLNLTTTSATSLTTLHLRSLPLSSLPLLTQNPTRFTKLSLSRCSLQLSSHFPSSPSPFSHSTPFSAPDAPLSQNPNLNSFEGSSIQWDHPNFNLSSSKASFFSDKHSVLTVVLLGWLGAKQKHLKKYAEMYNLRGVRSVRFVVPPTEALGFDLGAKLEAKVKGLAVEIADWCSEDEEDGRERHLMFHTFSNTGWLAYGVILDSLKSREDIIGKIRGCIVDSGPCADICPQVWAAGFCAALLKKGHSLKPSFSEMVLLPILRKFFEVLLRWPDVNRRLRKYISVLSENQLHCPQLYLYSSADEIIPARYTEEFIAKQKALGRTVVAHDFGSSPHVDHFRNYPHIYTAKVEEFLKLCSTLCSYNLEV